MIKFWSFNRAAGRGVAHLCGQAANIVFIEQVTEGANREAQEFCGARLVAVCAPQSFEDVSLFELF